MSLRAVLDVNILASAQATPEGVPGILVDHALNGTYRIVLSEQILIKLDEVLERPYFVSKVNPQLRQLLLEKLKRIAISVQPDPSVTGVADDEEDDRVIGTAVAAGADIIVTGDKGMLALRAYEGIPIVSAREFLDIIEG